MEGLVINLNSNNNHKNPQTFFQVYLKEIIYENICKVVESVQLIKINKLVMEYLNEPEFNLNTLIQSECEQFTQVKQPPVSNLQQKHNYLIYNSLQSQQNAGDSDITLFIRNYSNHYLQYRDPNAVQALIELQVKSLAFTVDPDLILFFKFFSQQSTMQSDFRYYHFFIQGLSKLLSSWNRNKFGITSESKNKKKNKSL